MTGREECARLQTGVPINTRDGLASSGRRKATLAGWRGGRIQRRAPHSEAHLSLTSHTYHALRPLPPTFDSSADPVLQHIRLARLTTRCKPPLLKVRLSIRGALNPLCPASAGPGQQAALHRALSPWPRLPGCPQDSCIGLPPPRLQKPSALPMLASVLAYGVFLSETQYPLWQLILAFWRTSGGAVYTTSRYTFP